MLCGVERCYKDCAILKIGRRVEIKVIRFLTSSNIDKILARCLVDFDVSLTQVVFVFAKGEVPMFLILKPYEGLAIPAALLAQTQRNAPSEEEMK